jgi:tripeptide aminopeptidase
MAPETTSGREPFIHLVNMTGDTSETTIKLLLRGFSIEDIRQQEKIIASIDKIDRWFYLQLSESD